MEPTAEANSARDKLGRHLRDLRISVTDRCNFRCPYCMPKEVFGPGHAFLDRSSLLTFEELAELVAVFASLGVRKVRLTGGEPLLRREIESLVAKIALVPEIEDLALTTNGMLLAAKAQALASAGLKRVTVSLDALDQEHFAAMNGVGARVDKVLAGIEAAALAGLAPIKINCVIRRGVNDTEILALVRRFRGTGHIVRFIEYMDVGTTNGWKPEDVVPASEILEKISSEFPIEPIDPTLPGEVATRYRFSDGSGEIGVIASITQPFCKECTRARLSADGHLFTCLFASNGTDLRDMVRSGATASQLAQRIASVWKARDDRYSELRDELIEMTARQGQPANLSATPVAVRPPRRRAEMSYLGG